MALPSIDQAALAHFVRLGGSAESYVLGNTMLHDDVQSLGNGTPLPQTFATGSVNTSADDHLTFAGKDYFLHADAFAVGTATMGALHAVAIAHSTNSHLLIGNHVHAVARPTCEWFDTVTLRSSNPAGSDFLALLALDDGLSPSVAFPAGATVGSAAAGAQSSVLITDQPSGLALATLSINDSVTLTVNGEIDNRPSSYIQGSTIHVSGSKVVGLDAQLAVLASGFDADAGSIANVGDTAQFYLFSSDPAASYTTDSGFSYVSEPGCLALLGMLLILCSRGRITRD